MRDLKYRKTGRRSGASKHAINAERVKLGVVTGDQVRVMRGNDRGKEGKILRVYPKTGRVVVEGVRLVKRHRKARTAEEQSGIVQFAAPIDASNVMLLDPTSGKPTRTRARFDEDGTKERSSVKSGEPIPRPRRARSK